MHQPVEDVEVYPNITALNEGTTEATATQGRREYRVEDVIESS